MDSIYWALILSFIAGAMGYIIVRFWLVPIARYRRTKRALITGLKAYAQKLPPADALNQKGLPGRKQLRGIRQLSRQLREVHELEVPYWFRLVLMTRNESPQAASEAVDRLERITVPADARQCLDEAGRHLGMVI